MRAPFAQHFLTSTDIAKRMVTAGGVSADDTVLEVGPGKGIITEALLATGATVVAVEKDPAMVRFLHERFGEALVQKQLALVEGDALEEDFSSRFSSYKLVANIPYNITGAILRQVFSGDLLPNRVVLLMQKEVAERIVAQNKKDSILSLSVKAYGAPRIERIVKRGSFSPPPEVDSAVLVVENISRDRFESAAHEERFFELVRAGFAQKRKKLANNLSSRAISTNDLARAGIPKDARAEDVPLEAWLLLSRAR